MCHEEYKRHHSREKLSSVDLSGNHKEPYITYITIDYVAAIENHKPISNRLPGVSCEQSYGA